MCQPLKKAIQFSKVGENKYRKYIEHVASIGLEKCKIHKGSNGYFMLESPESKKPTKYITKRFFVCFVEAIIPPDRVYLIFYPLGDCPLF